MVAHCCIDNRKAILGTPFAYICVTFKSKGPLLCTWLCCRGALFLGPGFRVTRNKLTFRDNLALLLESASPTDRQLEKRFKEWLAKCHKELDRTIKFEALCSQAIQVGVAACLPALPDCLTACPA